MMNAWRWLFSVGLAFTLAGCAAISSFQWMGVVDKRYEVTSGQGTMVLRFNMFDDPSKLATMPVVERDTWRKLDAFDGAVLTYNRTKENASTWSWNGSLDLAGGVSIPVRANVREGQLVLQFDGHPEPLRIPMHQFMVRNGWNNMPLSEPMKKAFDLRFQEIVPVLVKFLARHVPFPQGMTMKSTEIVSNGESIPVTHQFVQMNGEQLQTMVTGMLENILADKDGMNQTIEKIYALLTVADHVPAAEAKVVESNRAILNFLIGYMNSLFSGMLKDWKVSSKSNALTVNWWVDSELAVRQFDFDFTYYPVQPWSGLKGYRIAWERQTWDVGKPLVAEPLEATLLKPGSAFSEQPWIQKAVPKTAVYDVLVNHFQLTRKMVVLTAPATPKPTAVPKRNKSTSNAKKKATPTPAPYEKEASGMLWRTAKNTTDLYISADWLNKQAGWKPSGILKVNKPLTLKHSLSNRSVTLQAKSVVWYKNKPFVSHTIVTKQRITDVQKDPYAKNKWILVTDP